MQPAITVNLDSPIASAVLVAEQPAGSRGEDAGAVSASPGPPADARLTAEMEARRAALLQLDQALRDLVAQLKELYDSVFASQKEHIARLSLEIARKVLVQKVEKGDYQIQSIVEAALNNAPSHEDLVVHLNPRDFAAYEQLQQEQGKEPDGVKFVPDASIGPAECRLESPKGIIESMIDQHLEQIGKALKEV